jgi:hypothetical protein
VKDAATAFLSDLMNVDHLTAPGMPRITQFPTFGHMGFAMLSWYNELRPHSSLRALTPIEFANQQGDRPLELVLGSASVPLLNRPAKDITSTDSTYNCG